VPLVPWLPILSILCCLVLAMSLPLETWVRFFVWLGIGLAIYFLFSKKHSQLADSSGQLPAGPA
jgi:APA family basic amino acid/polyamine antiporter